MDTWGDGLRAADEAIAAEDFGLAEQVLRRMMIAAERDEPDPPLIGSTLQRYAIFYDAQDRFEEAEEAAREALATDEVWFGPDHPAVARDLHTLGVVLIRAGRATEALAPLERAREAIRAAGDPEDLHTTTMMVGDAQLVTGYPGRAAEAFGEAARGGVEQFERHDPRTLNAFNWLGEALRQQGRAGEAHERFALVIQLAVECIDAGGRSAAIDQELALAWFRMAVVAHFDRDALSEASLMYRYAVDLDAGGPVGAAAEARLREVAAEHRIGGPVDLFRVVYLAPDRVHCVVTHPLQGRHQLTADPGWTDRFVIGAPALIEWDSGRVAELVSLADA